MNREDRRQALHMAVTVLAVLLRWLSPLQAIALALSAIVLNWAVLPRLRADREWIRRDGDPWMDGVRMYPVAVLAGLLAFELPVAAAAWAVMGIGDGMANLVGRRWGRPPFLGRADRSATGSLAFVATAAPGAALAHAWVEGAFDPSVDGPAAITAAIVGALVECVPLPSFLDDNLPVLLASGAAYAGTRAILTA